MINRESQLQQYKRFIENCTTVAKSVNNYSDFKRINECLILLFAEKKDISILDFDDYAVFKRVVDELLKQEEFNRVNDKGNNQYSNTLKYYLRFLYAKKIFSAKESVTVKNNIDNKDYSPLQTIFYGTPGSGKSHKVKELVKDIKEEFVFRTTFHPDSDYASFVGCYKPKMKNYVKRNSDILTINELAQILSDYYNVPKGGQIEALRRFCYDYSESIKKVDIKKLVELADVSANLNIEIKKYLSYGDLYPQLNESKISYEFTPQAFTKAYVTAWKNQEQPVYLIIEEINRGNCAQIFGDLFQLLDRKDGVSEYPIDADNDLKDYLEKELGIGHDGIANGKLKLPANLNILATMSTSDQSLFPMDSAFKRRWDWECVPINYENTDSAKFTINIDGKDYLWHDFLKNVNAKIKSATDSEDKEMGNFFITGNVTESQFVNKVMFYLWNDICKEEFGSLNNFFRNYVDDKKTETKEFTFNELFTSAKKNLLSKFMEYIGVEQIKVENQTTEVESEY